MCVEQLEDSVRFDPEGDDSGEPRAVTVEAKIQNGKTLHD